MGVYMECDACDRRAAAFGPFVLYPNTNTYVFIYTLMPQSPQE